MVANEYETRYYKTKQELKRIDKELRNHNLSKQQIEEILKCGDYVYKKLQKQELEHFYKKYEYEKYKNTDFQ